MILKARMNKSIAVNQRIRMAMLQGKVLRSRVKKSLGVMTRTLPLLLLHLLIPLMFGMVNGRMKLKDGQIKVRLGPPVRIQNIYQHEYMSSPDSYKAKQQ